MGDVLGFVGTIAGSAISAKAQRDVAAKQIAALERQRQFVFENLNPDKINKLATAADIKNAKARLALQKELDPELYAARQEAEKKIRADLQELGVTSDKVADQAVKEALDGTDVAAQGKQKLIDAALEQLRLGATLPPDVQAELVKAGLEKGGMVVGAASPKGFGGQITRQLLGSAGVALQQQRQSQAAGLLGQAQNLENSRAALLGTLFPNLANTQLAKTAGTQAILGQINSTMAPVGLTGGDVTNLWLARVGGSANMAREQAQVQALAGTNIAATWQKAMGSAIPYAANSLPTTSQVINNSNRSANEAAFNEQFGGGGAPVSTVPSYYMGS